MTFQCTTGKVIFPVKQVMVSRRDLAPFLLLFFPLFLFTSDMGMALYQVVYPKSKDRSMSNHQFFMLILVTINLLMFPDLTYSQKQCTAPELSADQINEIVVRERGTRNDIPPAFPKYEYTARKQGCYYVYIEYGLPSAFEYHQMFWLNQFGVIVDVLIGNAQTVKLKCPEKVYTESELAEIIKKEREIRQDLPPPFLNFRVYVDRSSCLYMYYEYNLPEKRGDWQVFTIDPYGELMDYSRSKPY